MEPIQKVDENGIHARANKALVANDLPVLGALIDEVEEHRRQLLTQSQQEAIAVREAEINLTATRTKIAFLSEDDARKQYSELQFQIEFRAERSKVFLQQAGVLEKVLGGLRQKSTELQARHLATEIVAQAPGLADELAEAKRALGPLRAVVEKIFALSRQADFFNQQVQGISVPALILHGDPGSINKLGDLRLEIPEDLARLASPRKRAA